MWHHQKKITLVSHGEYFTCTKFQFFSMERFRRYRGPKISFFPSWLPHHVTYDVIVITKTFYMSSCIYGENFMKFIWWKARPCRPASIQLRFDRTPDPWRPLYQIKFRMGGRFTSLEFHVDRIRFFLSNMPARPCDRWCWNFKQIFPMPSRSY